MTTWFGYSHTNTVTELRVRPARTYHGSHARKLRSALIAPAVAAGAVAIGIIAPIPRAIHMYSQHFCRQNAEAPKMDPGMLYFSESMRRALKIS